jgi:ABC-type polar amino acid transport system ATPase subunit
MLEGRQLSKSFASQLVLANADVTLQPGKITVVIGPSGSGKTTLLRALSLLDPPDTGAVQIDAARYEFPRDSGKLLTPWPYVTVVFQQHFLWPHLTIRENILMPARNVGVAPRDFAQLCTALQIAPFLDRYPNEVSLGERQRAAVARAAVLQPHYILMDEITSALDVEQISGLLRFLPSLRDKGMGILLITHHLQFAKKMADEVIMLDKGLIVDSGSACILSSPATARLRTFLSDVAMAA